MSAVYRIDRYRRFNHFSETAAAAAAATRNLVRTTECQETEKPNNLLHIFIMGTDGKHLYRAGFLPARRYASAVFATATCPDVCPSARLSVTRWYCA